MSLAIDTSDLKPSRGGGGAGEGDKLTQVIDHSNKFLHNYPLVIQCSLGQDERKEATDVVVAALETTTDYLHTKVAAQVSAGGAGSGDGDDGGDVYGAGGDGDGACGDGDGAGGCDGFIDGAGSQADINCANSPTQLGGQAWI